MKRRKTQDTQGMTKFLFIGGRSAWINPKDKLQLDSEGSWKLHVRRPQCTRSNKEPPKVLNAQRCYKYIWSVGRSSYIQGREREAGKNCKFLEFLVSDYFRLARRLKRYIKGMERKKNRRDFILLYFIFFMNGRTNFFHESWVLPPTVLKVFSFPLKAGWPEPWDLCQLAWRSVLVES